MMRMERANGGWRFALLLVSGWVGLVLLLAAFEARSEEDTSSDRMRETRIERWNKASREERRVMRQAARDFWDEAPPEDRKRIKRRLRGLRRALPDFSRLERKMILRRTLEMPKAERDVLRDRIMSIDELDAEGRAKLERELRDLIEDDSDEMNRIESNASRWREMSHEDREKMRAQMREFRKLSVSERQQLLDQWVPSKD